MKKFHPSPALVIALIALFVALGGTSYAAINSLPANIVGTKHFANGAGTHTKLSSATLKGYGGTLPSGKTEVGDWGFGGDDGANWLLFSFPIPLAHDLTHAIYVSGASAPHCTGAGHAGRGYLCVYEGTVVANRNPPASFNIFNPETGAKYGASAHGWGILLSAGSAGDWYVYGTYAVTAP
jgi:hypothetical protein